MKSFAGLLLALMLRDFILAAVRSFRLGRTDVPGKFWKRLMERL